MLLRENKYLFIYLLVIVAGLSFIAPQDVSGEPSANDIIEKSEDVYPGMDQQSKLTFTIREPDGAERKVILRRYWKNYPDDPSVDSKVLVFHEYPPDTTGTSFMVWTYKISKQKPEDLWIYLPILRKVQKLPEHPDEIFSGSNLKPADMIPRDVSLDNHTLLREETIENQKYHVIESIPRKSGSNYNYGKVIKWINQDNYLKERIDYYSEDDALLKSQLISWKKVKDAYVWEKVVITNAKTNVQTMLSISEIEIDAGLNDRVFSERTMSTGKVR